MDTFRSLFTAALLAIAACFVGQVDAQSLNVDIVGGTKASIPIAVVPFAEPASKRLPTDVAEVIGNDFNRSGKFHALDRSDIVASPSRGEDITFANWRLLKQDFIVVGRIEDAGQGLQQVTYELWDVNKQQRLLSQAMPAVPTRGLRGVAHQIADAIYQKITGVRGAFWTRIAYVTAVGHGNDTTYSLIVADSDGFDPQVVVAHAKQPLLSPAWSPDGNKLAYVSFESGNSMIYVRDLTTGTRSMVSGHSKGINGAPAWSPDGTRLAVSLSYVGNPEIFVLNLSSRKETRLTHNPSIDTEPTWSPDGRSIDFTSDRSGRPQIYSIPATGGTPTRLTFQGQSNYASDIGTDGSLLAMVQGDGNSDRIAIADQSLDGQVRYVSPGPYDESPSFAPNASMLLYAATEGQRGVLYSVSTDGQVRQRLALPGGDVRDPAWDPYRTK